ncbi:MAG TPA: urate hydroxylase PuuD [Burkholderiaceae bacterium]
METYLLDWANLLLRWLHVITAIAWIGSSFYFVLLDNSLSPPEHDDLQKKGVDGEMWAVHGGGFYHSNKYMVAPRWRPLPDNLHWSYWESYSTWLTGFGLFTVLYLFNAGSFLVDKSVYDWSAGAAIAASLGFLVAFWFIYDLICRTLGQREGGDLKVGALVFVFIVFAAWLACQLFAGRAAFLLVGAMIATAMSANVFFWIIPGQRTVIAQLRAGQTPDAIHGKRGKQRSVHNTYFTLPVIVAMLSNHYGWLYQGPQNWLVLVLLMLAGALIRHSFVARHKAHVQHKRAPWEHAIVGVVVLLGVVVWLAPKPPSAEQQAAAKAAAAQPAGYAEVRAIVDQRCAMCHNADLQQKGIALHTPELLKQHAQAVYQQAAVLKLMPLSNATQMTEAERTMVKRWFEGGAPVQ